MKSLPLGLSLILLALTVCPTWAADRPLKATVTIDPAASAQTYDRMIFGGFLEHFHRQIYGGIYEPGSPLSDANGFRKDVIEAVRQLRTPVVRWPGGCFVSAYHWKDGVGPDRQPSYDKAWGVEDPNTFGTDEFVAWCRATGMEPYICSNAGTGTPEEMSDWAEYCNQTKGRWARLRAANGHPQPYHVRFWSVGNENFGDWEIGAKTADEWGHFVCETAKMMRRVDPNQVLTAAAIDGDWTRQLLKNAGRHLNMISIHGYWDPLWAVDHPADYASLIQRTPEPEKMILSVEKTIAEAGFQDKITIAFDEWNARSWHHPGLRPEEIQARDRNDLNATYTMADAVFSACFLNACLRHADVVKMANIAPLVNTRGPLYVHPKGIVKRTTYHVLEMYANRLSPQVASTTVSSDPFEQGGSSVPALDAVATCDAAGQGRRLVLVNRHISAPLVCTVQLGDRLLEGTHTATQLVGDSPDAFNDIEQPSRVVPEQRELRFTAGAVELPPHSVTIVEIR